MTGGWQAACSLARLSERGIVPVTLGPRRIVVLRSALRIVAAERACPHEGADLSEGWCEKERLHCPHHRASFDLVSGEVSAGWRTRPLRIFETMVRKGTVFVRLGQDDEAPDAEPTSCRATPRSSALSGSEGSDSNVLHGDPAMSATES